MIARRSPLKRKTSIRRVSKKKAVWLPLYAKAKKARLESMEREMGYTFDELDAAVCPAYVPADELEPHHINGRIGENILDFKFISRERHRWIHANGREAREKGWLK